MTQIYYYIIKLNDLNLYTRWYIKRKIKIKQKVTKRRRKLNKREIKTSSSDTLIRKLTKLKFENRLNEKIELKNWNLIIQINFMT